MRNKIAVQLYTLREECKADFPGVLRKLGQMGYSGVQFAGFHGYDPQELKAVIDEAGLKVAGLHVGWVELQQNTAQVIADAKLMDTKDIICPNLPAELRNEDGYRTVKRVLNECARRMKADGLRLSYHNHAFEFETIVEGKDALTYLIEPAADNEILAELDVYWLKKSGLDPAAFLIPYGGRMPILHLKDMTKDDEQTYAEIGTGSIAFEPILQWGEEFGVEWYVVEQDVCKTDPLECVQTSLVNLSQIMAAMK